MKMPEKTYVSMRGTEPGAGGADLIDDINLANPGVPRSNRSALEKPDSSTTFAKLNEFVKAGSNDMKANYQRARDGLRRVLLRPRKT
jgi:hypothetical protein